MIILIVALVFGAAVLLVTIKSFVSCAAGASKTGVAPSRIAQILKLLVMVESIIFLVIFIIVLLKTIAA